MKEKNITRSNQEKDLVLFLHYYFHTMPENIEHRDKPDLVIRLDKQTIGIEHTRVYRTLGGLSGLEPHAQEVLQFQIVEEAWQRYSAVSSKRLWLTVDFDNDTSYRKKEVKAVAASIERVVQDAVQKLPTDRANETWYKIEAWRHRRLGLEFPQQVRKIDFRVVNKPGFEVWGPTYGYVVPHLTIDMIRERIESKEKQLRDYCSECNEFWLLIVADTGVPSNHFEIDQNVLSMQFTTRFSKVFLMRSFHSNLHELNMVSKPA
jgi:hypothetical protein